MAVFPGAVDATFAAFGIDALYTPAGGDRCRCGSSRRPDTIVGLGETRIHPEIATFELSWASKVANLRPGDQLMVAGDIFVVQGEPERRDPDHLVWSLDARPEGRPVLR